MWDRRACDAKPSAWFALNAAAIRTDATDGLDGYTILPLPESNGDGDNGQNLNGNTGDALQADREGEYRHSGRPAVEYMLWELASAADGR